MIRSWLLALTLITACVGTETGNPYDGEGALGARPPMGIVPQPTYREAGVVLGELALFGGPDCDRVRPMARGPLRYDLLVEGGDPIFLQLWEGTWCGVRVTLAPEVDEPVLGVAGELTDGTALLVRLDGPITFDLAARPTFELSEGDGVHLVLDLQALFAGTDLASAPRVGGRVVIDRATDPPRTEAVEAALPTAFRLVRDADGDGTISPGELEGDPLAGG